MGRRRREARCCVLLFRCSFAFFGCFLIEFWASELVEAVYAFPFCCVRFEIETGRAGEEDREDATRLRRDVEAMFG